MPTDQELMKRLQRVASEHFGGHFTVMKFTTNWRIMFGTPGERADIANAPCGKTFAEAAAKALAAPEHTWQYRIKIEPGLALLHEHVRSIKDSGGHSFCANAVWYGYGGHQSLKEWMMRLVGFEAQNPRLRTMRAYDLAYETLYRALPDCRNCLCFLPRQRLDNARQRYARALSPYTPSACARARQRHDNGRLACVAAHQGKPPRGGEETALRDPGAWPVS